MGLWLGLAVDGGPCGGPGIFGFSEVGRRPRKSEEKRKRGHTHGGMIQMQWVGSVEFSV